jgi:hypothetical protein
MQGAVLYGPRDLRFEEREVPKIIKSTDAAAEERRQGVDWMEHVSDEQYRK